jgi:hypothetical protein
MNHGYLDHVNQISHDRFENSLLYSRLTPDEIRQDFTSAHFYFKRKFDYQPKIWRTPHFGEFRNRKQLRLIHSICSDYDYIASSSTTGFESFLNNSLYSRQNVFEIPLSGYGSAGFGVLDSWSFRKHTESIQSINTELFFEQFYLLQAHYSGVNSVFHFYLDPRHIVDSDDFWIQLKKILQNLTPISISDFVNKVMV